MRSSPHQQAIDEILTQFNTEMDILRQKFHTILKQYEESRIEHLKDLVSKIKSI